MKCSCPSSRRRPWSLFLIILISTVLIAFALYFTIYRIYEYFLQQDPMLVSLKLILRQLHPIVDKLTFLEANRSYTVNKRKIYLCLRDEKKQYYPMNMLIYVSIHELAHVLCNEIGHTDKFHSIFQNLLDKAIQLKLYDPSQPILTNYCQYPMQ